MHINYQLSKKITTLKQNCVSLCQTGDEHIRANKDVV